jgi:PAS domain S-box-containing protein
VEHDEKPRDQLRKEVDALRAELDELRRKQAGNEHFVEDLRDLQELLHSILDSLPDAIAIVDDQGDILYANQAAFKLLGFGASSNLSELDFRRFMGSHAGRSGDLRFIQIDKKENLSTFKVVAPGDEDQRWIETLIKRIVLKGREADLITFRDISERKKSEEALRESEERYRRITAAVTDYIYTVHVENGKVVRTEHSPACEAVTGYTVEEFNRNPYLWFTMVVEEDRQRVRGYFDRVLTGEPGGPIEHRIYCRDGSVQWVVNMPVIRRNDAGDIVSYDGVVSNITERKQAEKALSESEERYRLMAELTGKLVYDYDVPTGCITWHGAVSQVTGYHLEDFRKTDIKGWLRMIHPDDRAGMIVVLDSAVQKCGPYQAEYRLRRKDGSYIYVEDRGVFLPDSTGKAVRMLGSLGDVSKRKEAEEALKASEQHYRTVFESTATANIIVAEDMTILLANSNFEKLVGYSKEEMEGKMKWTSFTSQDDLEKMMRYHRLRREKPGSAPDSYEFRSVSRDGREHNLYMSVAMIPGTSMSVASCLDITERKKAEADLKRSEERFRGIANNLPGGVYQFFARTSGEMGLNYISENAMALLGLPDDQPNFFANLTACIAPEDRDRFLSSIDEAVCTESRWEFDTRYVKPTGEEMFLRGISEPMKVEEGLIFNGVILDITERKRAEKALQENEERFRSLIQSSLDIIVILDENGLINYESPSMEQVLKYPAGFMMGKNPLEFIHPDDRESATKDLSEVFQNTNDGLPTEFRFKRADGSWTYLEAIGKNLFEHPGINGMLLTARDITERKKAEELKLEMERRLLHAQKLESLGVMAGGIAHDFNNLLMAILGNLDLALLDLSPVSQSRPFIAQALVAARRAADLTNQMLAYSGKGMFDLKSFDISELVEEMARLLKASISKNVTLNLQLARDLPPIMADPGQIQQIIMNLIVNASEAIGTSPGIVTITTGMKECDGIYLGQSRLKEKPSPGNYIFLEVKDTGCGMDKETQERLFDPFFTTKFTGRGLGMAAVLGIVSGHKGAIVVDSNPGSGTGIRVMFPVVPSEVQEATRKEKTRKRTSREKASFSPGNVLVVDDEEMVLSLCKDMVERLGFKVLTAADGERAVAVFREHTDDIACVILDLNMPYRDGITTYDVLRKIRHDVKVIISSGYDEKEVSERFDGKGLAGFIKKPYQLENLRKKLYQVLESKK